MIITRYPLYPHHYIIGNVDCVLVELDNEWRVIIDDCVFRMNGWGAWKLARYVAGRKVIRNT